MSTLKAKAPVIDPCAPALWGWAWQAGDAKAFVELSRLTRRCVGPGRRLPGQRREGRGRPVKERKAGPAQGGLGLLMKRCFI